MSTFLNRSCWVFSYYVQHTNISSDEYCNILDQKNYFCTFLLLPLSNHSRARVQSCVTLVYDGALLKKNSSVRSTVLCAYYRHWNYHFRAYRVETIPKMYTSYKNLVTEFIVHHIHRRNVVTVVVRVLSLCIGYVRSVLYTLYILQTLKISFSSVSRWDDSKNVQHYYLFNLSKKSEKRGSHFPNFEVFYCLGRFIT